MRSQKKPSGSKPTPASGGKRGGGRAQAGAGRGRGNEGAPGRGRGNEGAQARGKGAAPGAEVGGTGPARGGVGRRAPPPKKPGPDAKVIKHEAGVTLARFVVIESGGMVSGREAKRLLETGACFVNGRLETFGSRVLESGDIVELTLPQKIEPRGRFAFEPARVVYEDADLLVYDKPAGLQVVQGDGKKGVNLAELVAAKVPEAEPVHRIDSDTSGLVVFGKTEAARATLLEAFKQHEVDKRYLALVRGQPRAEGVHKSYFLKVASGTGYEQWVSGHGEGAKEAITRWRLVEKLGFWGALVEVRPETGRHHQIRIHMAELGHPLVGDTRYGDRKDRISVPRHMLHASEIELTHPTTGKKLALKARLPEDFRAAIEALRKA